MQPLKDPMQKDHRLILPLEPPITPEVLSHSSQQLGPYKPPPEEREACSRFQVLKDQVVGYSSPTGSISLKVCFVGRSFHPPSTPQKHPLKPAYHQAQGFNAWSILITNQRDLVGKRQRWDNSRRLDLSSTAAHAQEVSEDEQ